MRLALAVLALFIAVGCVGKREPVPNYTHIVNITARQFEFSPSEIKVKVGQPVKLIVTSLDVDHGILIEGLKVATYIVRGRVSSIEFIPTEVGRYEFRCYIVCGVGHENMKGMIIVEK